MSMPAAAPAVADRRKLSFGGHRLDRDCARQQRAKSSTARNSKWSAFRNEDAERRDRSRTSWTEAMIDTLDNLPRARRRDPDAVAEAVRRAVRAAVAAAMGQEAALSCACA